MLAEERIEDIVIYDEEMWTNCPMGKMDMIQDNMGAISLECHCTCVKYGKQSCHFAWYPSTQFFLGYRDLDTLLKGFSCLLLAQELVSGIFGDAEAGFV